MFWNVARQKDFIQKVLSSTVWKHSKIFIRSSLSSTIRMNIKLSKEMSKFNAKQQMQCKVGEETKYIFANIVT
jgi:hypothetical protein